MSTPLAPSVDQLQSLPLPVPPFSYVPQTWGWWLLLGLLSLLLLAWAVRRRWRWQRERYRREALARIDQLIVQLGDPQQRLPAMRELPSLLKRVALSMPDAGSVAALGGAGWQGFLASHAASPVPGGFAERLHSLAYAPQARLLQMPQDEVRTLFDISRQWIETHHVAA